jgi:uncharacterized protein
MKAKKITPCETHILSLTKGRDGLDELRDWFDESGFGSATFSIIGACDGGLLAYYDQSKKKYRKYPLEGGCEILSLTGSISLKDGVNFVHAHGIFSRLDGSTVGGHVMSLMIFAAEAQINCYAENIKRSYNPDTGLCLMDL